MKPSVPYEQILYKSLKNDRRALEYLKACLEDEDPRVFLLALKDVAAARGGITRLARAARVSREHMYDMLSKKGNPGLVNLSSVLNVLGFKLSIEPKLNPKLKKAA